MEIAERVIESEPLMIDEFVFNVTVDLDDDLTTDEDVFTVDFTTQQLFTVDV